MPTSASRFPPSIRRRPDRYSDLVTDRQVFVRVNLRTLGDDSARAHAARRRRELTCLAWRSRNFDRLRDRLSADSLRSRGAARCMFALHRICSGWRRRLAALALSVLASPASRRLPRAERHPRPRERRADHQLRHPEPRTDAARLLARPAGREGGDRAAHRREADAGGSGAPQRHDHRRGSRAGVRQRAQRGQADRRRNSSRRCARPASTRRPSGTSCAPTWPGARSCGPASAPLSMSPSRTSPPRSPARRVPARADGRPNTCCSRSSSSCRTGAGAGVEAQRRSEANAFRSGLPGLRQSLQQASGMPGVVVKPTVRREESQLGRRAQGGARRAGGRRDHRAASASTEGIQLVAVCAKKADRRADRRRPGSARASFPASAASCSPGAICATCAPTRSSNIGERGRRRRPLVLTLGEPAGIGPDIAIDAWLARELRAFRPSSSSATRISSRRARQGARPRRIRVAASRPSDAASLRRCAALPRRRAAGAAVRRARSSPPTRRGDRLDPHRRSSSCAPARRRRS